MTNNTKLHIAYGDEYLDWQLGQGHPTNPIRAKYAVNYLETLYPDLTRVAPEIHATDRSKLEEIHDAKYIANVLDLGDCSEWSGARPDLGQTALQMFAGTARLTELMISGEATVAFNPQGAKHHAQYDYSSGFCVFNDMAWAARQFLNEGMKVMYIDWDVHHGDGVENLLLNTEAVTASIHEGYIYPGTGNSHTAEKSAYNWALPHYAGTTELDMAVSELLELAHTVKPDVLLLAIGADAHETDPLSSLLYDYSDYHMLANMAADIATEYAEGRVLIGGAGGYQPLTHTPLIWTNVVSDIYDKVSGTTRDNDTLALSIKVQ